MPTKTRIIIVSFLILLGGTLFSYCLFFHPTEIVAQTKETPTAVTESNPAPDKATSTSCEEQNKSTQSNQNSSNSRPRPQPGAI